jgi:hypothetical protein
MRNVLEIQLEESTPEGRYRNAGLRAGVKGLDVSGPWLPANSLRPPPEKGVCTEQRWPQ